MTDGAVSTGQGGGVQGFLRSFAKLPLVEKVVGAVAILVVLGWVAQGGGFFSGLLFHSTFATLSFLGALAIAVLLVLKLFEVKALPRALERYAIALLALLPLLGLVLESLGSVTGFLTVGGSLALAYISATSFWRKHLPTIPEETPQAPRPGEGGASPPPPAPTRP